MKTCPKCQVDYADEFAFCSRCGGPIVPKDDKVHCPACGREIHEKDLVYCPYCGAVLDPIKAAQIQNVSLASSTNAPQMASGKNFPWLRPASYVANLVTFLLALLLFFLPFIKVSLLGFSEKQSPLDSLIYLFGGGQDTPFWSDFGSSDLGPVCKVLAVIYLLFLILGLLSFIFSIKALMAHYHKKDEGYRFPLVVMQGVSFVFSFVLFVMVLLIASKIKEQGQGLLTPSDPSLIVLFVVVLLMTGLDVAGYVFERKTGLLAKPSMGSSREGTSKPLSKKAKRAILISSLVALFLIGGGVGGYFIYQGIDAAQGASTPERLLKRLNKAYSDRSLNAYAECVYPVGSDDYVNFLKNNTGETLFAGYSGISCKSSSFSNSRFYSKIEAEYSYTATIGGYSEAEQSKATLYCSKNAKDNLWYLGNAPSVAGSNSQPSGFDLEAKWQVSYYNSKGNQIDRSALLWFAYVKDGGNVTYGGPTPVSGESPLDESEEYVFDLWQGNNSSTSIASDTDFYAFYKTATKEFTITFLNEDGSLISAEKVRYGFLPSFKGEEPSKADSASEHYYFAGWSPEVVVAKSDATYTARFESEDLENKNYLLMASPWDESVYGIARYVGSQKDLVIPDTIHGKKVAFVHCYGENDATYGAFEGNTTLLSVQFPDSVVELGYRVFKDCTSLANVSFSKTITYLGSQCFSNCTALAGALWIPPSVEEIGSLCFEGCTALTQVNLPSPCPALGRDAFQNCSSSFILNFAKLEDVFTFSQDYSGEAGGRLSYSPFRNVGRLFVDGSEVTSLLIPSGVSVIDEYNFAGCTSLKDVTFPSSIQRVDGNAFADCPNLTDITLLGGGILFGNSCFEGCASLRIHVNEIGDLFSTSFDGGGFSSHWHLYLADLEITDLVVPSGITAFSNGALCWSSIVSLTLPDSLTTIGAYCFYNCVNLTSVSLPSSVTTIGQSAFDGCTNLKQADFASWESLFSISFENFMSNPLYFAHHLFVGGSEATSLSFPSSITGIKDNAFAGMSTLTSLAIPEGYQTVGRCSFYECEGLTSLSLPSSLSSIDSAAFERCSSLASVTFSSSTSLKDLPVSCFSGCISLKNVLLPSGIEKLGAFSFCSCDQLESITLPKSLTTMEDDVFTESPLKTIYYEGTMAEWGAISKDPSWITSGVRQDTLTVVCSDGSLTAN